MAEMIPGGGGSASAGEWAAGVEWAYAQSAPRPVSREELARDILLKCLNRHTYPTHANAQEIVEISVRMADALLEALRKGPSP